MLPKFSKALVRRLIWKIDSLIGRVGYSLKILDIPSVRGIYFSRQTAPREIEILLNRLRPIQNGHDLIRIGNSQDGGYLLPYDLEGVSRCLSAGCDLNWTFEKSLYSQFRIASSIIDSIDKKPSDLSAEHEFIPKWIGKKNDFETITFESWLDSEYDSNPGDLILQMDIEGFEWQALLDIAPEKLIRFRIISIELHSTQNLRNRKLFDQIYSPVIDKLLAYFDVIHLHPNNCCGSSQYGRLNFPNIFELTLHRKERSTGQFGYAELPNKLDVRNVASKPDLVVDWS